MSRYNVLDYGAGDHRDSLPAFRLVTEKVRADGGGTILIPPVSDGYWLNGSWLLTGLNGVTVEMDGAAYDLDAEEPSGCRLMFTNPGDSILVDDCRRLTLRGVTVDCCNQAARGIVIQRMDRSTFTDVGIYRCADVGVRMEGDPTGANEHHGCTASRFDGLYVRGSRGLEMVSATQVGGSWHNVFTGLRIDYSGDEAILLEHCDNNTFTGTWTYRRAGVGPAVRHRHPGWGLGPNSNYFFHLQGEVTVEPGVRYPGAIYGYDMSNGQAWPTVPDGCDLMVSANGLNAPRQVPGWEHYGALRRI